MGLIKQMGTVTGVQETKHNIKPINDALYNGAVRLLQSKVPTSQDDHIQQFTKLSVLLKVSPPSLNTRRGMRMRAPQQRRARSIGWLSDCQRVSSKSTSRSKDWNGLKNIPTAISMWTSSGKLLTKQCQWLC